LSLAHLVREPAGEPAGALVLFHGRGASEHDLYPLLDALDPRRRLLGLAPRGPLSLPPGGSHWYVLGQVGYPDPETFFSSLALASDWLDGIGVPPERTVLGGFSQGAVMAHALTWGRGRPRPAGVIALSGFVPTVEGFELDLAAPLPPVAIGHGSFDPVIDVAFGRAARDLLEGAGADVLYRESPLPHTVDPAFLRDLAPWLDDALPRDD
jgi:phospholipase/carboxylesterase